MSLHAPNTAFVSKVTKATQTFIEQPHSNELADMRLAVKDLFHVKGIPTAAGNPKWSATHDIPKYNNSSVQKLLEHGAQYVGKTLTDELAYSLNGQNTHYPELLNPVTPERLVGGSSSGSAAAVASKQAEIGLGTDTGGSIRVPASYNGLFGIRTTQAAIACDNMVPLAPSFDTVGWLTSNIESLQRVASVLFKTNNEVMNAPAFDVSSLKIFAPTNLIEKAEHAQQIYSWIDALNIGDITKAVLDADKLRTSKTFRVLQGAEIWQQHADWITQNEPDFAYDILKRIQWCEGLTVEQISKAKEQHEIIINDISTIFETHDILLLPTTPGCSPLLSTPPSELANYREELMSLTSIAGLTGRPQIHLPLFNIKGAPCGLSLVANRHTDIQLILLANQLIKQSTSYNKASNHENA